MQENCVGLLSCCKYLIFSVLYIPAPPGNAIYLIIKYLQSFLLS